MAWQYVFPKKELSEIQKTNTKKNIYSFCHTESKGGKVARISKIRGSNTTPPYPLPVARSQAPPLRVMTKMSTQIILWPK